MNFNNNEGKKKHWKDITNGSYNVSKPTINKTAHLIYIVDNCFVSITKCSVTFRAAPDRLFYL